MSRTIILLMDSFGIGYAHDAKVYGDEGAKVTLGAPASAVTPGQSAVFYDGDTVAFGGIIE